MIKMYDICQDSEFIWCKYLVTDTKSICSLKIKKSDDSVSEYSATIDDKMSRWSTMFAKRKLIFLKGKEDIPEKITVAWY